MRYETSNVSVVQVLSQSISASVTRSMKIVWSRHCPRLTGISQASIGVGLADDTRFEALGSRGSRQSKVCRRFSTEQHTHRQHFSRLQSIRILLRNDLERQARD